MRRYWSSGLDWLQPNDCTSLLFKKYVQRFFGFRIRMAGQSGKAKLWELANYGSIPEFLVFRLHYTRLTFAVNSFVPFCSFRVRISNSGFQTRGPTPLHWHARRAPMECLLGPCGATPLERHCAELTVHGVEVNTPAIPRLDPVLTPRHLPRKRLSQDTASPATDPRPADDILFPPPRTRISRAWRWTPTTIRCS